MFSQTSQSQMSDRSTMRTRGRCLVVFQGAYPSLAGWYDRMRGRLDPNPTGDNQVLLSPLVDWFKTELLALYDPTDPVEAAEQTLFALSGRMRVPPRAERDTHAT